jgi:hypothetical protein
VSQWTWLDSLRASYFINRNVQKPSYSPSNTRISNPKLTKVASEKCHIRLHPEITRNWLLSISEPIDHNCLQLWKLQWSCVTNSEDTCLTLSGGRAMAQAVSRRPLTAEARVRSQFSPCGICSGQSGTGTGFSPEYFSFPLSISFHRCFITWKNEKINHLSLHLHHKVAQ